jgi:hypothetical protein
MARAGFYPVESGKISFRRDGNWYSDAERIDNPRIAMLFSRSIHQDPNGRWYLQIAEERAPVTIEDTPYVVRTIEQVADGCLCLILNDGEGEPLDPSTLEIGADNVLYCRVKQRRFRARFLRPAYYHLSRHFEADGDRFFIRIAGRRYPLRSTLPDDSQVERSS